LLSEIVVIAVDAILLSLRTSYRDFTTVDIAARSICRLLVRELSLERILD